VPSVRGGGPSIDPICGNVTFGKLGRITGKQIYKGKCDKAGSEVPTAVAMKSNSLCDVTPCSLVEVYRRSGRT
jgi:hypothetical protein